MNNLIMLDTYIKNFNPWTKVYGLARSIIATAELLTLLTNPMYYFFSTQTSVENKTVLQGISIFRFTGISNQNLIVAKLLMILILMFVLSGYFPQISSILHLWVAYSDFTIMVPSDGGSEVAVIILTLMLPIALTDPRKNHWFKSALGTYALPFRQSLACAFYFLTRIEVAIIYFDAVVQKLPIREWLNGTAVYYYLNNSMFGLPTFLKGVVRWFLTTNLVIIPTYGALLTEIILVLFLVVPRKFWPPLFITASTMHIGFALFIGIPSFSLIMIGVLVIYLIPLDYPFRYIPLLRSKKEGVFHEAI